MDTCSIEAVSLASLQSASQAADQNAARKKNAREEDDDVDRGYAWVILLAVFGTIALTSVFSWMSTLLYQALLVRFELSASTAGWIVALPFSIRFLSSPPVSYVAHKFSYRSIAVAGGMLFASGVLIYAFAPAIWMLYTGSVLVGVGSNMVIFSALVILPTYFSKRRALAMSFALCGTSVGAMVYPPLVSRGFKYFGYTQTMIYAACVIMQVLVTSSLFRPKTITNKQVDTNAPTKSKWQSFTENSGLNLLVKPVFVHLMLVVSSLHWMLGTGNVFLSGLAIERANLSSNQIATVLSIAAVTDFCKIPVGLCFDHPRIRPYRMYVFCMICASIGVLAISLTFTSTMATFTICYTFYNIVAMSTHSQYITMIGDIVSTEHLPKAVAITRVAMGTTLMFVPAGIGRIKDLWNSFQYGFILLSSVHICIVSSYAMVYFCWNRRKQTMIRTDQTISS